MIDPSIFKAYDVRGLYPEQLDEDGAYKIGRAFARVIAELEGKPTRDIRVAVGRDMRLAANGLLRRYTEGIRDEDASVVDRGEVGTERLYFTVGHGDRDGGAVCA